MQEEFRNRQEMEQYVEFRYIPDIDSYARELARIGDVFKPDIHGLYDAVTGKLVIDFGRPGYFIDKKTRKKVYIDGHNIISNINADVYDHNGYLLIPAHAFRSLRLTDERDVMLRSREAAIGLFADMVVEVFDHVEVDHSILRFNEVTDISDLDRRHSKHQIVNNVSWRMRQDLHDRLRDYSLFEMKLYTKSTTVILDVGMDFRIKQYYLDLFDRQDKADQYDDVFSTFSGSRDERRRWD